MEVSWFEASRATALSSRSGFPSRRPKPRRRCKRGPEGLNSSIAAAPSARMIDCDDCHERQDSQDFGCKIEIDPKRNAKDAHGRRRNSFRVGERSTIEAPGG